MTDKQILIAKTRAGGNRMDRADTKDGLGNGVCPPQAVAAYSSLLAQAAVA